MTDETEAAAAVAPEGGRAAIFGFSALRWREHLTAYLLLAPALIVLTLYVFVPIGYTIWISFHDLRVGVVSYVGSGHAANSYVNPNQSSATTFFGTRNWYNLFHRDGVFLMVARNTIVMVGGATIVGSVLALLTALLVSTKIRCIGAFRTLYFFPAAISQVVTGLIFSRLFDQNFGLVNHVLGLLHLPQPLWQDDAIYVLAALTIAATWIVASYNVPIFAAGLSNVPRAQQEAAALDGAGAWATFRHVTLPALRSVSWFVAISSLVSVSQMLGLYDALGQDTVESSTLVKYMFARAFIYNDIDYAGAIGCVLIVALTLVAVLQLWISERGAER